MASLLQGVRAPKYRRLRNGQQTLIDGMPIAPWTGKGTVVWVDGTSGSDNNDGSSPSDAKATIQAAVTLAGANGTVLVMPKLITDTTGDPTSYAETVIIPATHVSLKLIGVSNGLTQGGLPQIKKGSGSTALLTIRAGGCYVANMGFNGASSTGGGILLDDDYSTKFAFGTTIEGCHIKNCKVTATNAATGGGIYWTSAGNAWQVRISGNRFYRNAGGVAMLGTSNTVPQDVVIENNYFGGPASVTDCHIFTAADGINGLVVHGNVFDNFPAVGSGSNLRFVKLTGSIGILSGNYFADDKTFGAAGNGGIVPTTMLMSGNYDEGGLIARV
jgi:hypothetical protein